MQELDIQIQINHVSKQIQNLELSEKLLGDCDNNAIKKSAVRERLVMNRAIKENLLAIQKSGKTLEDEEREAGVSFDRIVAVFKCFVEDVWKMRHGQKDPDPDLEQLLAYEKEVDDCLAILVKDDRDPSMKVLGQEGDDYQLNN